MPSLVGGLGFVQEGGISPRKEEQRNSRQRERQKKRTFKKEGKEARSS